MKTQPNVIIIMTDQHRADLCAREGFPLDVMPTLDRLAREGMWFDKAYTTAPICVPARISMLTGRYPGAMHVRANPHMPESAYFTKDLFHVFQEQGYHLGLSGKNHSHLKPERTDFWYHAGHLNAQDSHENAEYRAFAEFMKKTHFHLWMDASPSPVDCQHPYRIVSKAQEWIRSIRNDENPFLLWLSFPEPHNPYQVPEPYYSMFPPEDLPPTTADESALETKGFKFQWCRQAFEKAFPGYPEHIRRGRSNYLGMLRLIDDQVKRLVEFLDAEKLRDDTLIIFLADHGDFVGEYGLLRKGPEFPDCLARIPMIFNGPGILPNDAPHAAHMTLADIMPTLCDMIGAQFPDGVQGRSLWPLLTGQAYPQEEFRSAYSEIGFGGLHYTDNEPLNPADDGLTYSPDGKTWGNYDELNSWTQSGYMRMVRKDDWKLVYDMQGHGQLYNLADDPAELNNLYGTPEVAHIQMDMLEELLTWTLRAQDPLPLPKQRYVIKKDARNYWSPHSPHDKSCG